MPRTRVRIVDMSAKSQDPIGTALSSYFTCDISDALLKLGIPTGGFLPGISLWPPQRQERPTRVAGPAYTVKFVRNHQTNAPVPAKHYVRAESPQYRFWLILI
jgi:regulator of RNase E activity RraA